VVPAFVNETPAGRKDAIAILRMYNGPPEIRFAQPLLHRVTKEVFGAPADEGELECFRVCGPYYRVEALHAIMEALFERFGRRLKALAQDIDNNRATKKENQEREVGARDKQRMERLQKEEVAG
jgi:hypothetical protein